MAKAEEAEEHRGGLVVELAHVQAVAGGVTLSEVVGKAELVGAPHQLEVTQLDAVTDPVVAHVNGSRALLFTGIIG